MNIHLARGVASGPTSLSAFDAALYATGIANYNLVTLSSVIPPQTRLVHHEAAIPGELMPGQWGDRLYLVMAAQRTETPGAEVWAGIGWVQDEATGRGLFVEHEGETEAGVRGDIEQSLQALMTTRGIDFGQTQMVVIGGSCVDEPVCAMVAAVYQASSWHNDAHLLS